MNWDNNRSSMSSNRSSSSWSATTTSPSAPTQPPFSPSSPTQQQQQQQHQQHQQQSYHNYHNRRPAPIRIPALDDPAHGGTQGTVSPGESPRAALVAGIRSATDRRREKLMQQQQQQQLQDSAHTIQGQTSPQFASPSQFHQHQSSSSSSSSLSSLHNNQQQQAPDSRMDSRVYAAFQAKQQELLATSMLISQQQQRIQQAMSNAAVGAPPQNEYEATLMGLASNEPSVYDTLPPHYHPFRPSSPSLPVRPSSSASNRNSFVGFGGASTPPPPGLSQPYTYQPSPPPPQQQQQQQQQPQTPQSFRRGHRKASSLSSSVYNSGVGVIGAKPMTSSFTAMDIEQPVRQPLGPPPLDELKNNHQNFAGRKS